MKPQWWHSLVAYQIYPRSFCDSNGDGIGDIKGIISKLDYLKDLGIDILWLSPVYDSPNDDNGYDIRNYYTIQEEYGTMEDMEHLIHELNQRNMFLIMDIVANHTSDEHPFFVASRQNITNPYRDFYIWRKGENGNPPSSIESVFKGSAWEYDTLTDEYYLHLFSKKQPDVNWHNPKVREMFYDIIRFWIDKGVSGFRFDVIDLIGKDIDSNILSNGPLLHTYIKEMVQTSFQGKELFTVGEAHGTNVSLGSKYSDPKENELSMIFQFEHVALDQNGVDKWDLRTPKLTEFKTIFKRWQEGLYGKGWNSLFWNNHDQPRVISRFGDEHNAYASGSCLALLLYLQHGTPFIYQGEELGMLGIRFDSIEDYNDIETHQFYSEARSKGIDHTAIMKSIYAKSRDNSRTPMQWNTDIHAGFTTGTPWLPVHPNYIHCNVASELQKDHDGEQTLLRFYKELIALRKKEPTLTYGAYHELFPESETLYVYFRSIDFSIDTLKNPKETKIFLIICNVSSEKTELPILLYKTIQGYTPKLHNLKLHMPKAILHSHLEPYESMCIQLSHNEKEKLISLKI